MSEPEHIQQRKTTLRTVKNILKSGDYQQARQYLEDAFEQTKDPYLKINQQFLVPPTFSSEQQLQNQRAQLAQTLTNILETNKVVSVDDPIDCLFHSLFYLAYQGFNDRYIQCLYSKSLTTLFPALSFTAGHCKKPISRQKKRLGICSNNIRNNTIGRFFIGFLEHLSHEDWHIILLLTPEIKRDDYTQRYEALASDTITLPSSIIQSQKQVSNCELDLLFYLDLSVTPFTHLLAHARLAPVQFTTWGHPVTSGIPAIDYFLSFEGMEPADSNGHYTEKLVKLSHFPSWYKPSVLEQSPLSKSYFCLPEEGALYCCGHQAFKFHPQFDEILANILRKDPAGHIIIINAWNPDSLMDKVKQRMQASIADVFPRILFLNRLHTLEYLSLAKLVDVHLDPIHFGGGRTSFDLFANNKVIVTWPGEFQRGRVTYACCQLMKMKELIAADWSAYVEIAVTIANDDNLRASLEERIKSSKHLLLAPDSLTKEVEDFMQKAINQYESGEHCQESP